MLCLFAVIIQTTLAENFRGFLVQARNASGNPIGTFTVSNPGKQQTLDCDPEGVGVNVRNK